MHACSVHATAHRGTHHAVCGVMLWGRAWPAPGAGAIQSGYGLCAFHSLYRSLCLRFFLLGLPPFITGHDWRNPGGPEDRGRQARGIYAAAV